MGYKHDWKQGPMNQEDNQAPQPTVVDLKKRHMTFEKDGLRVITPLDLDEGQWYTEPIREEDHTYALENIYKLTAKQ